MSKLPKASSNRDLIHPYEMEDKSRYVARFAAHDAMKELFGESHMCREVAREIWRDRMSDATVTVRMVDGTEFFIN